ncbi:hypothetical protein [Pseudomonas shirazensis]
MKTSLLYLLFFFTFCLYSQEQIKLDKTDNFYLTFNKDEAYFIKNTSKKDNTIALIENNTISIRRKGLDIYLNWLNPLQYKMIIKDSIVNDVRVEEIKKFFTENISVISSKSLIATGSGSTKMNCTDITKSNEISRLYPDLFKLYENSATGKLKDDYCKYWLIFKDLYDVNIPTIDLKEKILAIYQATTPDDASQAIVEANEAIDAFEKKEDEIASVLFLLKNKGEELVEPDDLPLKNTMTKVYNTQKEIFINLRKYRDLLKIYIAQVKSSLQKKSIEFEGYYRIKTITLLDGKSSKIGITLSQRELKDDFSLTDKIETKKINILLQRYDFITPKIGTGLFYANTKIAGYSTTTDSSGGLTVSKDDIEKNTAVTGVFLNLIMDVSSQFITPLIQIGVDPTKERPYLLLGGGFAILNHFSITAGPIWMWEPTLNKLEEGGAVSSNSALEDDLSYKFNSSPKGFYLGLNYTF